MYLIEIAVEKVQGLFTNKRPKCISNKLHNLTFFNQLCQVYNMSNKYQ